MGVIVAVFMVGLALGGYVANRMIQKGRGFVDTRSGHHGRGCRMLCARLAVGNPRAFIITFNHRRVPA